MTDKQLECRILITHWPREFDLAMADPLSGRVEPLGRHPLSKIATIVRDLRVRMERERHLVTFSELTGPR